MKSYDILYSNLELNTELDIFVSPFPKILLCTYYTSNVRKSQEKIKLNLIFSNLLQKSLPAPRMLQFHNLNP